MKKFVISFMVVLVILSLSGCANSAEPTSLEESSGAGVAAFCLDYMPNPDSQTCYLLLGMRVFQKVPNGYLLVDGWGDAPHPALLITNERFAQNEILGDIYAYYTGEAEYTTLTGFQNRVHAWKIFHGTVTKKLLNAEEVQESRENSKISVVKSFVENGGYKFENSCLNKKFPGYATRFRFCYDPKIEKLAENRYKVTSYVDLTSQTTQNNQPIELSQRKYFVAELEILPDPTLLINSEIKIVNIKFSDKPIGD